tara:strand:- start:10610 stop:11596 length:987 start_codon:yes stop_codon:yes gene_type:complete
MKIYFFWPFKNENKPSACISILSSSADWRDPTAVPSESYEFYTALEKMEDIKLVNSFNEADFIIYMMDLYNCYNMSHYNNNLNIEDVINLKNNKEYKKTIVIDYNDWIDTRNVPEDKLMLINKYFKRSMVKKEKGISKEIIKYSREIIPILYGIRSDFIEYDKKFEFIKYNYDICCMFPMFNGGGGFRSIIPNIVNKYQGKKFIGRVDCHNRYGVVSTEYFKILKTSKIIVTANPPKWEGDFRLWEALLMGNLVLCDKMLLPSKIKYPLENKKHLVYYSNPEELEYLINYYMNNETERNKIAKEGRDYCLKYHKFSDRVLEVLSNIKY